MDGGGTELLILAYQKLLTNNNELINTATQEISNLTADPTIINSLFLIFDLTSDINIRKHASITLKDVIKRFREHFIPNAPEITTVLLKILSNNYERELETIQDLLFDAISILLNEQTYPLIFSYIQNSIDSQNINYVLLSCRLLQSFQDISPFVSLCVPIVTMLQAVVNIDIKASNEFVSLGFRIRPYVPREFFDQVLDHGIQVALNSINNKNSSVCSIIKSFLDVMNFISLEKCMLMVNVFLPIIGNSEIDPKNQILFASVVKTILNETGLIVTDTELMFSILIKFFDFYLLADIDPNIFEFVQSFVKSSPDFLKLYISKFSDILNTQEHKYSVPAIISLSYCFNSEEAFPYVNEIGAILAQSALNPNKDIRTSAAETIKQFAFDLKDQIDEIYPVLINSLLDSLLIEYNNDIVESLTALFITVGNSDSFFEKAFSIFITNIENDHLNLQHTFPSFVALCAASRPKSDEYFQRIYEIYIMILMSCSDSSFCCVKEFAVDGIKNLAIQCFDKFGDKINILMDYFLKTFDENDEDDDLIRSVLSAVGEIVPKYSELYNFSSIISNLFRLVEKNEIRYSSLALSASCGILSVYPQIADSLVPSILQYFQILGNETNEDSTLTLLRAMTIFSLSVNINDNNLLISIVNWTTSIISHYIDDNNDIVSEALSIFIELIQNQNTSFDYGQILIPIFDKLIEKEYDEDLSPTFAYLLMRLISKGVLFDNIIPKLFEKTNSPNFNEREFGLKVLGQLAESFPELGKSEQTLSIDIQFITKLVELSIHQIYNYESSVAAFVINQMATGTPQLLQPFAPQLMQILLEQLSKTKNSKSFLYFADNCVTSFAMIVRNIVKASIPYASYLPQILEKIPAKEAIMENYEMFHFFLWVGNEVDFKPVEPFAAALVRLFGNPIDDDVIGHLATNDALINTLKSKLKLLLGQIENPDAFINAVCNGEHYKLQNIHNNFGNDL